MIYGYARVSTKWQDANGNGLEVQQKELRNHGAEVIYSDAYTGTMRHRPEFDKLMERIHDGDTLVVAKLDRIARSAKQGIEIIDGLWARGVKINILNMGVIDNTATGKLIRTIFMGFAEFERDMIVQRTQEGKAIAKEKPGFHEGRPKKFTAYQLENAMSLLQEHSFKEVEQMTGISRSTLAREKRRRKMKGMLPSDSNPSKMKTERQVQV
ncbi:recombinase family protein [Mitsuokella jalaludinii]|uniref:recombinase family protein n=1 Tax=Mitsuokella jalaludinii TaxID=187979 RepID=UPI003078E6C1